MILEKFAQFNPIIQALLGTAFTYAMTALGAAGVFLGKEINRKWLDAMMGFAAGVMIANSGMDSGWAGVLLGGNNIAGDRSHFTSSSSRISDRER